MRIVDQIGSELVFKRRPEKIISAVPSITELLYDLGLNNEVIGITKFCVHPEHWFRSKTRIGGTKNLNLEKIANIAPDLILANKEENVREQITHLQELCNVYVSDVSSLEDAIAMINDIGNITRTPDRSNLMSQKILNEFEELAVHQEQGKEPLSVAYLIWNEPLMVAASNTFIDDVIRRAGLRNIFSDRQRYPVVELKELQELQPNLLFLSSEPFPFKEKHADGFRKALQQTRVMLVDGTYFSWYGSRLLESPAYLRKLKMEFP